MGDEGRKELHKRIVTNLAVYAVGLLLLIFVAPRLIAFFMPMLIAWIIATIANPMVHFLEDKIKIMRKHGSAIVIVAVLLLVGGLLYLAVYATARELISLVYDLPGAYKKLTFNIQNSLVELHRHFSFIPENLQDILGGGNGKINSLIQSLIQLAKKNPLGSVGTFASSVINMVILAILTLMLAYFFVAERNRVKEMVRKCIPQGAKNFWNMAVDNEKFCMFPLLYLFSRDCRIS